MTLHSLSMMGRISPMRLRPKVLQLHTWSLILLLLWSAGGCSLLSLYDQLIINEKVVVTSISGEFYTRSHEDFCNCGCPPQDHPLKRGQFIDVTIATVRPLVAELLTVKNNFRSPYWRSEEGLSSQYQERSAIRPERPPTWSFSLMQFCMSCNRCRPQPSQHRDPNRWLMLNLITVSLLDPCVSLTPILLAQPILNVLTCSVGMAPTHHFALRGAERQCFAPTPGLAGTPRIPNSSY
jgi:hypothetical protein